MKALRGTAPLPVDLDKLVLPGSQSKNTAYEDAATDKASRNRLQDYLRRISDDICLAHKADIMGVSSAVNFSLSAVTSTLGGVGAIVTGVTATRALSGSAAISNAFREDVNENIYYNNIAPAILRQIDLQRQKVLQEIQPKMSQSVDDYSVDAAIRDISEYHNQCSFALAVASLANENSRPATADEINGRIQSLRTQYQANLDLIAKAKTSNDSSEQKRLQSANKVIDNMIQSLTMQLGLVQGTPVANSTTDQTGGVGASLDSSILPLEALSPAVGTITDAQQYLLTALGRAPLSPAIGSTDSTGLKTAVNNALSTALTTLSTCQAGALKSEEAVALAKAEYDSASSGDRAKYEYSLEAAKVQAGAITGQIQIFSRTFTNVIKTSTDILVSTANSANNNAQSMSSAAMGAEGNIKNVSQFALNCTPPNGTTQGSSK